MLLYHREYFDLTAPLDEMAAILADDIYKLFFNENGRSPIQISLEFVPSSPIDADTPALVQVIAWCRTGDKPLPEAMLTQTEGLGEDELLHLASRMNGC